MIISISLPIFYFIRHDFWHSTIGKIFQEKTIIAMWLYIEGKFIRQCTNIVTWKFCFPIKSCCCNNSITYKVYKKVKVTLNSAIGNSLIVKKILPLKKIDFNLNKYTYYSKSGEKTSSSISSCNNRNLHILLLEWNMCHDKAL